MSAEPRNITPVSEASLADRILAGNFDGLPEHYSNEEWIREAQAARDGDDDRGLLWMVRTGREAERERERQWQRETGRYSLNDYLDGVGRHPFTPEMEVSHVG